MKASEFIKMIQSVIDQDGDLDLYCFDHEYDHGMQMRVDRAVLVGDYEDIPAGQTLPNFSRVIPVVTEGVDWSSEKINKQMQEYIEQETANAQSTTA